MKRALPWVFVLSPAGCTNPAEPPPAWDFTDPTADGKADGGGCVVGPPPVALQLDPFYTKYCSASGVPIVAGAAVPDGAVRHAAALAAPMVAGMPRVVAAMNANHMRFALIGVNEKIQDLPEFASTDLPGRGYGATPGSPVSTTGEENVLCYEVDGNLGESIVVHEFGHSIKNMGLEVIDPTFKGRVQTAYDDAIAAGKYKNLWAAMDPEEYWAEGVQDYFDMHQTGNPADVNTKQQLAAYDPELYAIIDGVFAGVQLPAECPTLAFSSTNWFRLENVALGSGISVDAGSLNPTGNYSGQYWHITAQGGGAFRLTNMWQGAGQSLDVANDGVYEPVMAPTGDYSGQAWTITPITNGQFRFVSAFQPTKSLEADGTASAPTFANGDTAPNQPTQAWTIRRAQ